MRCELCNTQGVVLYGVTLDSQATTLYRCPSCGCCQIDPPFPPELVLAHYRDAYYSGKPWQIAKSQLLAADYLAKLSPFLKARDSAGRTALEVGAGYGFFANSLSRSYGISVDIVEPSLRCQTYISQQFPALNLVGSHIQQLRPKRSYDDIFAFHVIEHLPRLTPFLQSLSGHLKPGGHIHLLTPNADSSSYRHWGRHWGWACPNQHYQFLSPHIPDAFFALQGFHVAARRVLTPAVVHFPSAWRTRLMQRAAALNRRISAGHPRRMGHRRLLRRLCEGMARHLDQNQPPTLALRLERWWQARCMGSRPDELYLLLEQLERQTGPGCTARASCVFDEPPRMPAGCTP